MRNHEATPGGLIESLSLLSALTRSMLSSFMNEQSWSSECKPDALAFDETRQFLLVKPDHLMTSMSSYIELTCGWGLDEISLALCKD